MLVCQAPDAQSGDEHKEQKTPRTLLHLVLVTASSLIQHKFSPFRDLYRKSANLGRRLLYRQSTGTSPGTGGSSPTTYLSLAPMGSQFVAGGAAASQAACYAPAANSCTQGRARQHSRAARALSVFLELPPITRPVRGDWRRGVDLSSRCAAVLPAETRWPEPVGAPRGQAIVIDWQRIR